MSDPQAPMKQHCVERLDRDAAVHRSGHQNVHARRYVVSREGRPFEVAIIVKPDSSLQLWCEADAIEKSDAIKLGGEPRPGSETYTRTNANGVLLYGRHSALKTFDRLHRGDALRFVPKTIADVDRILNTIAGRAAP